MIVVDDCSSDGSWEWLQQADYPHLTVLRNDVNRGVNYTRNRGIERAQGEYVLFLDSDDKLMPGGLDVVLDALAANLGVVHFLFFVSSNSNHDAKTPYRTTYREWLTETVYGDFTHVIRREVLLRFPFFEQFRAYENLNWLRILQATEPQLVIPETVTWVDLDRTDNLTKTLKLKTTAAIEGKFTYLRHYFELYGPDLYAFDPQGYQAKFQHALLLGIAAGRKPEARAMLAASPLPAKARYQALIGLVPPAVLSTIIRNK
jgi:glycosyltransferase involved in cell wall biosynthesis